MRTALKITLTALILAAVFALGFMAGKSTAAEPETVTITYPVYTGQTLWEIAGTLKAQYNDSRDIREIIYYIRKDNGGVPMLYSGQRLKITIQKGATE